MKEEEELPADASTLIYLAKADAFTEAAECLASLLIPPSVWREAVEEGERIGAPEVPRIHAAVGASFIRRVSLGREEQRLADAIATEHRLGAGESEVLALAKAFGRAVIDEGRASRVAEALGIVPVSTLFLPVLGRQRGMTAPGSIALLRRLAVVAGARAEAVLALEQYLRRRSR